MRRLLASTAGARGMRASSTMPYPPSTSDTYRSTSTWRESSITGNRTVTTTTTVTRTSYRSSERRSSGLREVSPQQTPPVLQSAIEAPSDLYEGDTLVLEARFLPAEPSANITWSVNGQVSFCKEKKTKGEIRCGWKCVTKGDPRHACSMICAHLQMCVI